MDELETSFSTIAIDDVDNCSATTGGGPSSEDDDNGTDTSTAMVGTITSMVAIGTQTSMATEAIGTQTRRRLTIKWG